MRLSRLSGRKIEIVFGILVAFLMEIRVCIEKVVRGRGSCQTRVRLGWKGAKEGERLTRLLDEEALLL